MYTHRYIYTYIYISPCFLRTKGTLAFTGLPCIETDVGFWV